MFFVSEQEAIMRGRRMYRKINEFRDNLEIGDRFKISGEHLALEYDYDFIDGLIFRVVKKYPHVVLLEKSCPKKQVHRQSLSYVALMMYGTPLGQYPSGRRGGHK